MVGGGWGVVDWECQVVPCDARHYIPQSEIRNPQWGRPKGVRLVRRVLPGNRSRVPPPRPCRSRGRDWPARRARGRSRSRHVLALGGQAVPGNAAGRGRCRRTVRAHAPGARAGLRLALERAGAGRFGPRVLAEDRLLGARSHVRAASPAVGRGRQGLRDARRAADGGVLELLGQAHGDVGAREASWLADRVLRAARPSGPAALPRIGERLDRRAEGSDRRGRGRMRRRDVCAAAQKHGGGGGAFGVWVFGSGGWEKVSKTPQSEIRNPQFWRRWFITPS